jgi:hypothetical protein
MKRYAWLLLAGALAGASGLALFRALPASGPAVVAPAAVEITTLSLVLGERTLDPASAAVPKGHRVVVAVHNARPVAATLVLQGYEDLVAPGRIAPGAIWQGEFVAGRPGEAFAWLADGHEVGRLAVTGSHLVEGHR